VKHSWNSHEFATVDINPLCWIDKGVPHAYQWIPVDTSDTRNRTVSINHARVLIRARVARMDGFTQVLEEVEKDAIGTTQEFPDLTPEARKEVRKRLDQTVESLLKMQRDLKQIDGGGVDARTVQVVGLHSGWGVKGSDFEDSFAKIHGNLRRHERDQVVIPAKLNLNMEHNYKLDVTGRVVGAVEEFYLTFRSEEDVCYALGLMDFTLYFSGTGRQVKFAKPAQSSATRAMFRKIGKLVERVRVIEGELKSMGAVWDGEGYKPDPNKYLDKSWYVTSLAGMKRAREAGQSIDRHAYGPLKQRKPLDVLKFQAQTKKLYDEECDCLMALREFQVNGVEFDF